MILKKNKMDKRKSGMALFQRELKIMKKRDENRGATAMRSQISPSRAGLSARD